METNPINHPATDEIVALYQSGLSIRNIATRVRINRLTIRNILVRNHAFNPPRLLQARTPVGDVVIMEALKSGLSMRDIARTLRIGYQKIRDVRDEYKIPRLRQYRQSKIRYEQIGEMAERGHTSHQIAATLKLHPETIRTHARRNGITIRADKMVTRIHDTNHVMEQLVLDADLLTADTMSLINLKDLDQSRLPDWIASLRKSYRAFGSLIRRLSLEQQYEQQEERQQPDPSSVESVSGAHQQDADATGSGHATPLSTGTWGLDRPKP